MASKGIVGMGYPIVNDPDAQRYVVECNRADVASGKAELGQLQVVDSNERKLLRQLAKEEAKALTKGFTPKDPEVSSIRSRIYGLEESQKMSVHVRQNIEALIKFHSELAQLAEQRMQRAQAVKGRGEKTQ